MEKAQDGSDDGYENSNRNYHRNDPGLEDKIGPPYCEPRMAFVRRLFACHFWCGGCEWLMFIKL